MVKRVFQLGLVYIVLILPDTNALRINFHQLGQRVHQTATDTDSTTHGDILVGKFISGYLRS